MGKKSQKAKPPKRTPSKVISTKAPRIPDPKIAWRPSTVGSTDLEELVLNGMLQHKDEILWNSCLGQQFPLEAKEELMQFKSSCERGFSIPAIEFVQDLMEIYNLELHHLTPNGVSHIAIFVHFFKTFLGVDPSLDSFRYIFHVKAQPSIQDTRVVGGARIQLHQGSKNHWFPCPMKNKQDRWESEWFTIGK
jgi:hypothetical protein